MERYPFRLSWEEQVWWILLLSIPLWGVPHFYLLSSILPFTKHTSYSLCITVAVIVTWEVVFVFHMGQLVAGCVSCYTVKRPVTSHRTFIVSHFKTSDIWLGPEIIGLWNLSSSSWFVFFSSLCLLGQSKGSCGDDEHHARTPDVWQWRVHGYYSGYGDLLVPRGIQISLA